MKKLERLTLRKLRNEMTLIQSEEQSKFLGGDDPNVVVNYVLDELQNEVTGAYNSAMDAAKSAMNSVGQAAANGKDLARDAAEAAASYLLDKCGGGGTLFGAPFFFINSPALLPPGCDGGSRMFDPNVMSPPQTQEKPISKTSPEELKTC